MSRVEILKWCRKYDTEEDQWNPELEKIFGDKFRVSKEITKKDLIEVVKWKFITFPGRLKRELNLIRQNNGTQIRQLSKLAFETEDELQRIKYLIQIKGVGLAVASAILTFYDPQNYGVFDIHVYDEIFGTNPQTRPKDIADNPERFVNLLEKLREIAKKYNLDVRRVEKALFKKNYDESK